MGGGGVEVQEAVDEVAVDEAEGFVGVADLVAEGAVGGEGDVARRRQQRRQRVLQVDEQRLRARRQQREQVDGAFDLADRVSLRPRPVGCGGRGTHGG